jgi:dTDP-4-amino-4,6-dideoxygalactose transaminase
MRDTLYHGDLIMRQQLRDFEDNIAKFVGTKYAIGLNSGTDALYFSLLAAGIHRGHDIITVGHTFVASIAAIVHCEATPILVDIGNDFNMDMDKVEQAITPRTKAIMPVHLNGHVCDMEKLMKIAYKHKLIVIEDAAQALGATFNGKMAGSFGLTGCFSFYPAKVLGCFGDGGMVTTDNKELADNIRLLRDNGQDRTTGEVMMYGYNSRLDNIQAAILNVKLKHLPDWIHQRRYLASLYEDGLTSIPQVTTPPAPQSVRYFDVFTNYVIRARNRDKLVDCLRSQGIEILISWPKPIHHHRALGLGHFNLPNTEQASREVVSLPLFPEMGSAKVEYVIKAIKEFYGEV